MCETSLRRIFIPPFQQLKEFRGHLAIWNCQISGYRQGEGGEGGIIIHGGLAATTGILSIRKRA
jgi:hypothetical protein